MSNAALHAKSGQRKPKQGAPTTAYVLGFDEVDRTSVAVVGGKGAHLGDLSRVEGIRVPAGFCVTTDAFRRITADARSLQERPDALSRLKCGDQEAIGVLSAEIRRTLQEISIPNEVASAIASAHARLGEHAAYAVRSSATAEDLPTASFAGQQDTYLNVVGVAAVLHHVSLCWASLFTERAVAYRLRNGFDQRKVQMAVVVQRMVVAQAAGILFTADPVTGNRKVTSVEASFGLGEALVSGLVNADAYEVREGEIVAKAIGRKQLTTKPSPAGGTRRALSLALPSGRTRRLLHGQAPWPRLADRSAVSHRELQGNGRPPLRAVLAFRYLARSLHRASSELPCLWQSV